MSQVSDGTWGGRLDTTSDYNMYFRMGGGTNRGFVFRNNTTNVAQIDSTGNFYLGGHVFLPNKEPTDLSNDGELAFDSSRGLILYRTQQVGDESGNGGYTVLDTSNIAAGSGITISNTAANTAGTTAITISATGGGDADTVDSLHAASFIRSDASDNVAGHTEWQDNQNVRLGNDADFRMWFNGTDTYMRSYLHGARFYLGGEDAAGTNRNMIFFDPDERVSLYYNGTEKLRTQSSGALAYGTLEASGGIVRARRNSTQYMQMQNDSASGGFLSAYSPTTNRKPLYIQNLRTGTGTASGSTDIIFRTNNNSSPTEAMRIMQGGNVYARSDLYVEGSDIYLGENGDGDSRLRFWDDNSDTWRTLYWDDSANKWRFNNLVQMDTGLQMNSNRITSVADPTGAQDAATKAYVDSAASNADTVDGQHASAFIRSNANDDVTGHTEWQDNMQVRLGNDADFRISHDATNHIIRGYKHGTPIYIQAENAGGTNRTMIFADPDNKVSLYYAGSAKLETASHGVVVNGRITGLSNPTAAQNAATKSYVDTRVDDRRMTCSTVRWDQGFERPNQGGNRYMVYNDAISVNRRCQELGYAMGVPRDTFTHAQWCVYGNARTARWQQGAWVNMACQSSASVEEARCCKN